VIGWEVVPAKAVASVRGPLAGIVEAWLATGDAQVFDERAPHYETGWLGKLHHDIVERSAARL
jgi:hypothetical protein